MALLVPPLLVATSSLAAAAVPETAESFVDRHRETLRSGIGLGPCPAPGEQAEIVVCGRRGPDPYRLPLGSEPDPNVRRAGEVQDQRKLLALGAEPCTSARRRQRSDGFDLLAIAATAVSIAANMMDVKTAEPQPVKKCS